MTAAILLVGAWLLAAVGAALIALGNRVHWTAVTESPMPDGIRRRNATGGTVLLLLAIVLCVVRDGWGMGLLLGPLLIEAGIVATIGTLALRPRALQWVTILSTIGVYSRRPQGRDTERAQT